MENTLLNYCSQCIFLSIQIQNKPIKCYVKQFLGTLIIFLHQNLKAVLFCMDNLAVMAVK